MYRELIFRQGAGKRERIYPEDARKLVAAACDDLSINPLIFNRGSDKKTVSGLYGDPNDEAGFGVPPKVLFDAGEGYLRIYGVGQAGAALLDEAAPTLFGALYRRGFLGVDRKDGEMQISSVHEKLRLYAIRRLIVAKRPAACAKFIKAPIQSVATEISSVILRGLAGVARMLDDELTAAGLPPSYEAALPYRIEVLEGEPIPIPIKPGVLAAGYKNVLFAMPTKLSGPWATGRLRSRGYGFVRLRNPAGGVA